MYIMTTNGDDKIPQGEGPQGHNWLDSKCWSARLCLVCMAICRTARTPPMQESLDLIMQVENVNLKSSADNLANTKQQQINNKKAPPAFRFSPLQLFQLIAISWW